MLLIKHAKFSIAKDVLEDACQHLIYDLMNTITKGIPSVHLPSVHSQLEFCSICGTQIAFRKIENATTVDVTIASLEVPTMLIPEYHVWTQSQISWFDVVDHLPRYQDAGPDI